MATHYCPKCLSLIQADQFSCETCQQSIPATGWPRTRPGRYGWLGEELEDRYRLVQFIGFGSTGEVYRAVSERFGRSFAAKIIDRRAAPKSTSSKELEERLRREISILGELDSPYVVPLVDVVQPSQDLIVLIMDLARGSTLERIIFEQGWIPPGRSFEIAEQILEALGDIHDHGVVHRDLKPANMIVKTLRSGRPFLRLLDFGTAKLQDEPALTTGFIGTPLFSAPEQIRSAVDVDARCDLYSVGCILFNMLTGRPPFAGETTLEVMQKHLAEPVPQLPQGTEHPEHNQLINDLLRTAMAKDPADRFASAAEMLSAPVFTLVKSLSARERPAIAPQGEPPPGPAECATAGTIEYPITLDFSSQAAPVCVAVNSAADIGVSLTDQDEIVLHDLLSNLVTASEKLPLAGRPAHLFFTRDEQCLCVASENGGIAFYQPRPLELIAAYELIADLVRWAGPSARTSRGALLLSRTELILVEAASGEIARLPIGQGEAKQVSAGGLAGEHGHRIFFAEFPYSLWIRENEEQDAPLQHGFHKLPLPVQLAGRVMDVSRKGVLLVEKGGQFFEFDPSASEFRSLTEPTGQHWDKALWMSGESRIVILSTEGKLYLVRRGDRPELLHQGVTHLAVNADHSRLLFTDESHNLLTWHPALPPIAAAITIQQEEPLIADQSWDIAPNRLIAYGVVQGGQALVAYQRSSQEWATLPVQEAKGIQAVRWSGDGSALMVAPSAGPVRWLDLRRNRTLLTPMEVKNARHIALTTGGQSGYLATEEGLLMALGTGFGQDRARVVWRRQLDKETSALAVSLVSERLVVGYRDGSLETFELSRGAHMISLPNTQGPILDFSFSADGHLFATLRQGGVVEVYDSHAGRLAYREKLHHAGLCRIVMAEDGTLVAARRQRELVETFAVETGSLRESYKLTLP
ncbi:MAG: protein kinase [Bradymonadales bacterium]|nr:protein kinase [Bradymonadales bacterium]